MLKHHTEQRDFCEGQWKIFTLAQGLNFLFFVPLGDDSKASAATRRGDIQQAYHSAYPWPV